MRLLALTTIVSLAALVSVGFASEDLKPENETDRINYSIGYQIGGDFKRQGVELNPAAVVRGIQDALLGAEPLITAQEMRATLVNLKRKIVADQQKTRTKKVEKYRGEGREFLAANAKKPGVVTLRSGLQYKEIREGTGKKPGPHDTVTVHYRGTRTDGTEFDSSDRKDAAATFRVDGVIRGWTEALQLMQEGAKWQLFIPPDLAYGERGPLRDETVIFDVELIAVDPPRAENGA
ncbi:MAG: FKBP-type peptidyl-prolyl cis-trans isomerase [Gammaproteobacteria bacterium]|nr:FKBP-type peptidyl-prolyl cis-trans isomerase [Gammaproteobacteria bacterium]